MDTYSDELREELLRLGRKITSPKFLVRALEAATIITATVVLRTIIARSLSRR